MSAASSKLKIVAIATGVFFGLSFALAGDDGLELHLWILGSFWGVLGSVNTIKNAESPGTVRVMTALATIGFGILIWLQSDQGTGLTILRCVVLALFVASQLVRAKLVEETPKNAE